MLHDAHIFGKSRRLCLSLVEIHNLFKVSMLFTLHGATCCKGPSESRTNRSWMDQSFKMGPKKVKKLVNTKQYQAKTKKDCERFEKEYLFFWGGELAMINIRLDGRYSHHLPMM